MQQCVLVNHLTHVAQLTLVSEQVSRKLTLKVHLKAVREKKREKVMPDQASVCNQIWVRGSWNMMLYLLKETECLYQLFKWYYVIFLIWSTKSLKNRSILAACQVHLRNTNRPSCDTQKAVNWGQYFTLHSSRKQISSFIVACSMWVTVNWYECVGITPICKCLCLCLCISMWNTERW